MRNFNATVNNSSDNRVDSAGVPAFQQIACGSEHSFALTKDGELYSWGLNFKGQLGLGDFENRLEPVLVESMIPIDGQMNATNKKNLLQIIKRSKSKEAGSSSTGLSGGLSQRNNAEEMKFS